MGALKSGPAICKRDRAPDFCRWTVGLDQKKKLETHSDKYDVLALCTLGPNVVVFVDAKDVRDHSRRYLLGILLCPVTGALVDELVDQFVAEGLRIGAL